MNEKTYNIVGYGSLMSHKLLKETCKDKRFQPVIVKGYKRVFNIAEYKSKDPDVLNLEKSKESSFNGVVFKINEEELLKMKKREDWYNLEESDYYAFDTNNKIGKCYLFIDHLILIDKHHKNPNKKYFILCREAAYHLSKKFGEFWDNTTFVSSGEKISEWIRKNPEYNTIS